jgi:CRISPR-associated protein Cas1
MELHLNTYGTYLKKKDYMFEVSVDGKQLKLSPDKISSIIISNAVFLTSDAVQLAMEHNIDIVFLDQYGDPYGRVWYPKLGSTTLIRRKQLELMELPLGLSIVKTWQQIKIMNQYRLLKTLLSKREKLKNEYDAELCRMQQFAMSIENTEGRLDEVSNSLMGFEGGASKLYFSVLAALIPVEFVFKGRSSRPAHDAFNAFLNYGYGILYSKVEKALVIAGIDPYLGLLHADNYNKKSFVFDFIEMYRVLVDEPVFYLFSRHKIKPEHIEPVHEGVKLSTEGKKFFAPLLLAHFDEIVRYHNKNRKQIDCLQTDAHALANYLIGQRETYLDSALAKRIAAFLSGQTNDELTD